MFDPTETARVVALQQQSYGLLRWVGDALKAGTLRFAGLHDALGLSDAARDWLRRNEAGLPPDLRPDTAEDRDALAHLLASFLATSFDLAPDGVTLRAKTPGKKAAESARQMKTLYLSSLAAEAGVALAHDVLAVLLSDPAFAADISYATYGRELMRRSQFASQGEGVLVLWREIAWDAARNRLNPKFTLSADRILEAEANLVARLKETTAPR